TNWQEHPVSESSSAYYPVWEGYEKAGHDYVTLFPLFPHVRTFEVDSYPDQLPSQHAMHQSPVLPDERCAIYSQQLGSTFWSKEIGRLPKVRKPYKVTRYQTTVVPRNAFGGAVAQHPMTVFAAAPLDLEINGEMYRTSNDVPITVNTDATGRLTLR